MGGIFKNTRLKRILNRVESIDNHLKYEGGGNKLLSNIYKEQILNQDRYKDSKRLEKFGYKVYSQNDEDGIINEIFRRIGTTNRYFIEFGVQDGLESNTHFLLFQGWSGLFIEGSEDYYNKILKNFAPAISKGKLAVMNEFITAENINEIFSRARLPERSIDLLSIDIDGNDYHIFNAINTISPRVVVIEFNAKFPPPIEWVMPYNPKHIWDSTDKQGMSLESITKLADSKGYQLVGTNFNGVNAFFVKKELCEDKFPQDCSATNLYNPARLEFREMSGHMSKYFIGYE